MKKEFDREDVVAVHSCFKHFASKADVELRRCCAMQLVPLTKVRLWGLHPSMFFCTQ